MFDSIERPDLIGETDVDGIMNINEESNKEETVAFDEEIGGNESVDSNGADDADETANMEEETNAKESSGAIGKIERSEREDTAGGVVMDEDTQRGRFLTFSLGNESYGIEIVYVTEIIGIQAITEIPELPEYINGIINLRGKIIPVMDVRLRFKKEPKEYNDRTCVIVVDIKDISLGLIVDSVSEVLSIPEEDIVSPPKMSKAHGNRYIKKIGKVGNDVKLLLDCEELLVDDEIEDLKEII